MLLSVLAAFDVMVGKSFHAKHLEYTLELVNDQRVVEELWQNQFFELIASSTTEQNPMLSKIPKTEDALNLSVCDGQIGCPESMVVFIENDNVLRFNHTLSECLLSDVKGLLEPQLFAKFVQLIYQMFFGRDDDDFLTGITFLEDSGNPTDNRCLTSTWQHTDVGSRGLFHVPLEGRPSHNSALEWTGFKVDSGLL